MLSLLQNGYSILLAFCVGIINVSDKLVKLNKGGKELEVFSWKLTTIGKGMKIFEVTINNFKIYFDSKMILVVLSDKKVLVNCDF